MATIRPSIDHCRHGFFLLNESFQCHLTHDIQGNKSASYFVTGQVYISGTY